MLIDKAKIAELRAIMGPRDCVIKPAERYDSVSDLCILTSYFNPCGYAGLLNNYLAFKESIIRSGLRLITVECAFRGAPFQLSPGADVIQVRADSIVWQKECLLNVGLQAVKGKFPKVAWLDADLYFADPQWAVKTSAMLDEFQVVQPFSEAVLLPKGMKYYDGDGTFTRGIVSTISSDRSLIRESFADHGHTGYAWAARIEALPDGFFDGCLLGSGDHVMAHAILGDIDSKCIELTFFDDVASRRYFEEWAFRLGERMNGSVAHCDGFILHLWHGSQKNRKYFESGRKLARFGVNPEIDLRKNADGCWEWNTRRQSLQNCVAEYFVARNEDEQ